MSSVLKQAGYLVPAVRRLHESRNTLLNERDLLAAALDVSLARAG